MNTRYSVSLVLVLAVAAFVGVLAAHSQPSSIAVTTPTIAPTPIPTPGSSTVNIEPSSNSSLGGMYVPSSISVRVHQAVTWVNEDSVDHNVTFDDGTFDSGVLGPGEKKTWTPTKSGTHAYGDFLHPDVRGVVVVNP